MTPVTPNELSHTFVDRDQHLRARTAEARSRTDVSRRLTVEVKHTETCPANTGVIDICMCGAAFQ